MKRFVSTRTGPAFLIIVVTMMAVADMNWPSHMGDRGGLMALVTVGL